MHQAIVRHTLPTISNVHSHSSRSSFTVPAGRQGTKLKCRAQAQGPQREILRELCSIGDDTWHRANQIHSGLLEQMDSARLLPVVNLLLSRCHLTSRDLQLILIRHPQTFTYSLEQVTEVLSFLEQDVGLTEDQMQVVVTRFPQVFSFSVKAHLKPQLPYLVSLGVEQHQLAEYITARPLLLGEGIETVIRFLKMCGLPRKQLARLLRSYPIDYCCRFIFKRSDIQPDAPDTPPEQAA